jgi:hypothetical protein
VTQESHRCRQCGWVFTARREQIPRYGARVRCMQCGTLFPLLERRAASSEEPAVARIAPEGAGTLAGDSAPAGMSVSRPARGEAREIIRLWLREVSPHGRPIDEARLFREHGAELARLLELWQASYPGEEATAVFKDELLAALGAADARR